MPKNKTQRLVTVALLIAAEVVLSRYLSINTAIVRVGFGFVPVALAGILYGPLWAAGAAAIGDIIGVALFPTGPFFPGFTLTALLTGLTYGLLLHNRQKGWLRVMAAALIVCVPLNLCLDTLWLYMLSGQGYLALLPTRIVKCVVMAPVQILILRFMLAHRHLLRPSRSVSE